MTKRILVIEDDLDIRQSLAEILEIEGYQVMQASHGIEALKELDSQPAIDLILLDSVMPEMGGQEFLGRRKLNPWLSKVPVILLTAQNSQSLEVAGVAAIILKPFELDQLLDAVRLHTD